MLFKILWLFYFICVCVTERYKSLVKPPGNSRIRLYKNRLYIMANFYKLFR